jgi:hypothetical protein
VEVGREGICIFEGGVKPFENIQAIASGLLPKNSQLKSEGGERIESRYN